ncbi:hypothetical protein [Alteromonas sp. M12]|uniref:hypothetical protein n=1 Tax=Alteromonas sp. M12 TaxID=3135644 RepID=UPI00319DB3CA
MKTSFFLLLFVALFSSATELNIDIDKGFLGAKWLSSKDKVIEVLGEPNGSFRINKHREFLFYGKNIGLLISRNQLREIVIGQIFSHHYYDMPVIMNNKFNASELTINNEIFIEQPFKQVEKALNISLGNPGYNVITGTDDVTIKLSFSGTNFNGIESSFKLNEMRVTYQL